MGEEVGLELQTTLSILSQLLPATLIVWSTVTIESTFQFFPSCFLSNYLPPFRCSEVVFQFFPSCFMVSCEVMRFISAYFQFFPSCFEPFQGTARTSSMTFNSFPVASEGFVPGLAYKAFSFPSEACKTASHYPLTHEKLLTLSTSKYVNPVSRRELLP